MSKPPALQAPSPAPVEASSPPLPPGTVLPPTPLEVLEREVAGAKPPRPGLVRSLISYPFRRSQQRGRTEVSFESFGRGEGGDLDRRLSPVSWTARNGMVERSGLSERGGLSERSNALPGTLLSGRVDKWTNYVSQWKLRHFDIVPGMFQLYVPREGGATSRDEIPLVLCKFKPIKQLEAVVTHSNGPPLKLRFPSPDHRSSWLRTMAKAKQLGSPPRYSDLYNDRNETPALALEHLAFEDEAVAIARLADSLKRARSDFARARTEIDLIAKRLTTHFRDAPQIARELLTGLLVEYNKIGTLASP
ncbi:hypothetical protein GNI_126780 [Gregarina niphandrodes]|uniref:PH domain-containing protein n=1 Tax=Gregarina niphandrodes TaxID=110365 RepID=A0A023B2E8_GRENI|nr:hypothetical protein GNI_126780 [Gregarina niphandrodes]EZG49784.1 hypothetical protein GNI_126780 [Gregarina niphandrodes]|eukprot:XP_011132035.1 hypothetical protein GNI_126780 [Gregarina niphandrodes]